MRGPIACWNFARTSSLITWSLYEMRNILRYHLIFMACILLCNSAVIHKHTRKWMRQGSTSVVSWNREKCCCHSKLVSTLSTLTCINIYTLSGVIVFGKRFPSQPQVPCNNNAADTSLLLLFSHLHLSQDINHFPTKQHGEDFRPCQPTLNTQRADLY